MLSFAFSPDAIFLTGITTWTPRKASTRAVSKPIPLVAPESSDFFQAYRNIKYNSKYY
ncbi:hypothetical protein Hanom_Chr17g01524361 [Helianthus anomalus]